MLASGKMKADSPTARRPRPSRAQLCILLLVAASLSLPILMLPSTSASDQVETSSRAGGEPELKAAVGTVRAEVRELKAGLQSLRTSVSHTGGEPSSAANQSAFCASSSQVGLQKDALQKHKVALQISRAAQERLQLQVAALQRPWLGHAGEVLCATAMRCSNYIDAGDMSLMALSSVAACKTFCNATYPRVPFFAFHNEAGGPAHRQCPAGHEKLTRLEGGCTGQTQAAECLV